MAVNLRLTWKTWQPTLQKLRAPTMITSLKEDVRHGMGTMAALGMALQSTLHQATRFLMVPQFVMRKRIGTQKPPVVTIRLSDTVQQRKVGLQAILSTAEPKQPKGAVCLLEEKSIPRKFLHMLADQCQRAGAIAVDGPGQRLDVLPLPTRHAVHTLEGLYFTCLRCGVLSPVLELSRHGDMGHGKMGICRKRCLQTLLRPMLSARARSIPST